MSKKTKIRIGFIVFTGMLMAVIFLLSAQSSGTSNDLSKGLLETIFEKLGFAVTAEQMETCNLIIRKIAHFTLYFLLGVGAMGALRTTAMKPYQCFFAALFVCAVFAASDELHQFVLGTRNGNAWDVVLDSFGAVCGVTMLGLIEKKRKNCSAADR